MSKDIEITYDSMLEKQMLSSSDFRNHIEKIGFTVVGAAVPHSGVDTGALMQSMGHRVESGVDGLELVLGSGAATGVQEIWYAAPHLSKQKSLISKPSNAKSRKRRPHPTKPGPTLPWTKALGSLMIPFTIEPGGFPS